MKKRVLLCSAFKPFGVDSIYARRDSKIELYHNQLTKYQGIFSPRFQIYSFGLHAIANNIDTPATVLDFPSWKRFQKEVRKGYDIVGIGAILPNFQKVKRMVEEVRRLSPQSVVVLGGFCAALPDIKTIMDVDHVCIGEGIRFMRMLLDLPEQFDFKNTENKSELREILGVPLRRLGTPHIVVGLGCSYGCDFCSPSHFFGKKRITFFNSGKCLFDELVRLTDKLNTDGMGFVGDDNFLVNMDRAEEFHRCVVDSGRQFSLFFFASADTVASFGVERLAEMGTNMIWIGRESKFSSYSKNQGTDIKKLVADLSKYGIKVILSSILLTDEQTRENIWEDINEHLACHPTFSQFSFYAPMPGTPLFDRLSKENRILTAIPFEEWHAFKQPWFVHPDFDLITAEKIQEDAYGRDFRELGPSLMRYIEVDYNGWRHLKNGSNSRLSARAQYLARNMGKYRILLLAMAHLLREPDMKQQATALRRRIEADFGPATSFEKIAARGLYMFGRFREIRTRFFGDTLQPPTRITHYNT